ncbi:MAG: 30S ribosomal protein S17 [Chloroflexi bacterium]|nr:30S ribosomal protein S17 [Chloroflexota bacterium]
MSKANQKTRTGTVVSTKMDKTVVVAVSWRQKHLLYGKSMRRISRFAAHDERGDCRLGDTVRIRETRPLSATKRWRVAAVLQRGEVPEVKPAEIGAPALETVGLAATAPEGTSGA